MSEHNDVGSDDLARLNYQLDTLQLEVVKLKENLKEATRSFTPAGTPRYIIAHPEDTELKSG